MFRSHTFGIALVTTMLTACASHPVPSPGPTDTLLVGPLFLTDLSATGERVALRVDRAGRITATYAANDPLPDLARQTLPGAFATAGLIDAHLHLAWLGRVDEELDLSDATSLEDVVTRVTRFQKAHPYLDRIVGHGWDETRWTAGAATPPPHARDLPDLGVPIILGRVDGHALWLDRHALARLDTLDAPHVMRDAAGPTGILVDPPQAVRDQLSPRPTGEALTRHLQRGLDKARQAGLVEVHDMATSVPELLAMAALPHPLPARVVVYLDDSEDSFAWLAGHPDGPVALTPDVWVAGVKLFADGALGSRGAALKADYTDQAGHRGWLADQDALTHKAIRAAELGYPVAIHAIGDRANLVALEIIEAAERSTSRRLVARIEHAQVLDLADLDRFRASRTVASMQPSHAISDMRWAEQRLGPRIAGAYAWRTLHAHGIPLAFGSDAPIESVDPCLGLHAATTRTTREHQPPGGWRPQEALDPRTALAAFTTGPAHAAALPIAGRTGRLELGARAELTLFEDDPRKTPWPNARVVGTHR